MGRKDRLEYALISSRAGVEESVFQGAGCAIPRCHEEARGLGDLNVEIQTRLNVVSRALEAPARKITKNADMDGSVVNGTILESQISSIRLYTRADKYGDMDAAGIIVLTEVMRTALQDAPQMRGCWQPWVRWLPRISNRSRRYLSATGYHLT